MGEVYRARDTKLDRDGGGPETPASWSRPIQLFSGAFFTDGLGHKTTSTPSTAVS